MNAAKLVSKLPQMLFDTYSSLAKNTVKSAFISSSCWFKKF